MSLEVVSQPKLAPLGARLIPASRGWVEVHPRFREILASQRLLTAEAILELPGEIVSGHPDRHVLRVEWGYLKRQHSVSWRERLRQKLAGFGWSSRCVREARILKELEREGLPCPQWIAFGEDGDGRAFLLVEELAGFVELRRLLSDNRLSLDDRTRLAERLGQAVVELHVAGFTTPDLTAKHVYVNPETFAIALLDWQNANRLRPGCAVVSPASSLAALDASLADDLAEPRMRLRFLWAYSRVARRSGFALPRFSKFVREIGTLATRLRLRRSIRDQRQAPVNAVDQRLVWVAGEVVCAIPEIAANWPKPAIAPPFYSVANASGSLELTLPDGRPAKLIRGRTFAPLARLVATLRGKTWRSPGVRLGRVLFHLQRYGLPAPQLYAFGQRSTEWFALFEPPQGRPLAEWLPTCTDDSLRSEVLEQADYLLKKLDDAGCVVRGEPFVVSETGRVSIGNVEAIRIR